MKKENCQVLNDKSRSGKSRNWALHKIHSQYIALAYEEVDIKKAQRMKDCSNWLSFVRGDSGLKLHDARFCRVRLCPICQWRRSLRTYAQMAQILSMAESNGYQFIFLTLTIKNCEASELSSELTHIFTAFNRLMKYKDVKKAVHGYYRGCEVTHNISFDTYHPHLHCVLAVRKSYFSGKVYLSQARWSELWQRALQVDYTPVVDIRRCNGSYKSISEACKYAVKPSDILVLNDWEVTVETLRVLDSALENRRFIGLGGIFKDYHKAFNFDDMENGDLIHVDTKLIDDGHQNEIIYFWNGYNQYESR